jgi:hypothetical protein
VPPYVKVKGGQTKACPQAQANMFHRNARIFDLAGRKKSAMWRA